MSAPVALDRAWLAAHPLPGFAGTRDKNSRGKLLCAGGGANAPGALLLTGEAALRAGCGKVQIGAAAFMVPHLAAALPEAGLVALEADAEGNLALGAAERLADRLSRSDAAVVGCGTAKCEGVGALTAALLDQPREGFLLILDAGACIAAKAHPEAARRHEGRLLLIPHPGEMAALMEIAPEEVAHDPARIVAEAVARFGAVVALRGAETLIGAPDAPLLRYPGGGVGLATGGSGDVCAGVIGGLAARGADPLAAAAWGVWAHGEAGRALGAPGFLARELLPLLPGLLSSAAD